MEVRRGRCESLLVPLAGQNSSDFTPPPPPPPPPAPSRNENAAGERASRPHAKPHLQLALLGAGVQLKVRDADGGDDVALPPGVAGTVGEDDFVVALTGS